MFCIKEENLFFSIYFCQLVIINKFQTLTITLLCLFAFVIQYYMSHKCDNLFIF